jgi:hypothetical protein
MNLDQILAAFSPADAVLSVKGALQIGHETWGVFDDEPIGIVVRNPHHWPCDVRLHRNAVPIAEGRLDYYERLAFAVESISEPETIFYARFTVEGPPEVDPIGDDLRVYSLGGKRNEVLTDEGIAKAATLAARQLWNRYLSATGPENLLADFAWHVEAGSTAKHAASKMETSTEFASEWMAEYKEAREKYLLGMMLEAKQRVESQLKIIRSLLSGS